MVVWSFFSNSSIVNSQTNLLNVTNLCSTNASFSNSNVLTLKSGTGNITTLLKFESPLIRIGIGVKNFHQYNYWSTMV